MKTTENKSTALYIITCLDRIYIDGHEEAKMTVYKTKNAKRVDQFISAMKKRRSLKYQRASIIKIDNYGVNVEVIDENWAIQDDYRMNYSGEVKSITHSRYGDEYLEDDPRFIGNWGKVHSA